MALPQEYRKDFEYLKGLSDKGMLNTDNVIYKKLVEKAKILKEVKKALDTLSVNY